MSALGGILAAVEQRVAELLDGLVKRLENLEQTSATGAATDDLFAEFRRDLEALSARVTALETSRGASTSGTASQTRTRTASASAGAATAKGKAADAK